MNKPTPPELRLLLTQQAFAEHAEKVNLSETGKAMIAERLRMLEAFAELAKSGGES